MPVQRTNRGLSVTPAPFEQPFQSAFFRFGLKGLNINDAIDGVDPNQLTRMLNVTHRMDSSITARLGQAVATGGAVGTNHHSIRRLNGNNSYTRFYGIDGSLYYGQGSLALSSSGFSGEPLSLLQYHPPLSGESWMFVGDTSQMVKVREDGLTLPIGLPAPGSAAVAVLSAENKTDIANFTDDGTQAANWTGTPGYTYDTPPVQIDGTENFEVGDDAGNLACNFGALLTTPTPSGYYAYWGVARTMDLSKVGAVDATDDDYIHLKLNFSHTQFIKEFRVYLVCSETFSSAVLPGLTGSEAANGDAYVKAFSANDFAQYIQAELTQSGAAELARVRSLRDEQLTSSTPTTSDSRAAQMSAQNTPGDQLSIALASTDVSRTITLPASAGSDQWQPFGVVGIPLRRGDFQRIGNTTDRGWNNITGIVVYVQTGGTPTAQVGTVAVRLSDMYMTGGSGPDSGEAADSPFDYRYTHYDPRTGAESNPSPVMTAANYLDSLRRPISVTPAAYSDGAVRQKIYRRGGTIPTDWFYVGTNSGNGSGYIDTATDAFTAASSPLEIDNYQAVPTVDGSGNTVLGQPLSNIWGPLQNFIFGVGDPYRPGHVYFCKPGMPDSWPDDYHTEVTAPSEPLLCGCLYGGQSFVFSSERAFVLYPNLSGDIPTVTAANTGCTRGPVNRWALTVGMGGMYFVNSDGIYRTVGGSEEWLSADIDPIFRGNTKNGYFPINFSAQTAIRLEIFENELWFQYQDSEGHRMVMIYSIPYQFWRTFQFGNPTSCFYGDEGNQDSVLLMGGADTGLSYFYEGTSDNGSAISCSLRTKCEDFGQPRLEKRLGDQSIDIDCNGREVTLTNYLNFESIQNPAQAVGTGVGRVQAVIDPFGTTPQRARNMASDFSWSTAAEHPILYATGVAHIIEPEVTMKRVTEWDDFSSGDPVYLMGVTLDADTGGQNRTINVDIDYGGQIQVIDTFVINCNGRHKFTRSWPGYRANMVRLRPSGEDCDQWQLFRADWNYQNEPPSLTMWDSYFQNGWDQYYTGLDLYCDTFGQNKTIEVYVDEVLVKTDTVNANGRLVRHITLPWGRGHVFRFRATDPHPGVLYDFRWHLVEEPSEQTNWNQNFTTESALYDKWLKAVVFECDTFGEDKTVTIEIDGVVVETLTVNANGRKVVQKSFPQHLGRVFRVYPTDDKLSRLYNVQFVFDGEPFMLDRWETQEVTNGMAGWSYPTYMHLTYKSDADVTLTISAFNQSGAVTNHTYVLTATAGQKIRRFVPLEAHKGILHKYLLTSSVPFTLYQEETTVFVREWGTDQTSVQHPFGDSDQDSTRNMFNAALAAARPGGTSS